MYELYFFFLNDLGPSEKPNHCISLKCHEPRPDELVFQARQHQWVVRWSPLKNSECKPLEEEECEVTQTYECELVYRFWARVMESTRIFFHETSWLCVNVVVNKSASCHCWVGWPKAWLEKWCLLVIPNKSLWKLSILGQKTELLSGAAIH